jgi:putative flippase GtrA
MTTQFLRYAGAGAVGTLVHYATLVGLVQLAGASPVPASTAGAIAGACVNYGMNHRFTFASRKSHLHALPRFFLIAVAGVCLNAVVLAVLLAQSGIHYLLAQAITTAMVLAGGYFANRAWTF